MNYNDEKDVRVGSDHINNDRANETLKENQRKGKGKGRGKGYKEKEKEKDKVGKNSKRRGSGRQHNNGNRRGRVSAAPDNDFSWYNTLPELTDAAGRFPFSRPLGVQINWDKAVSNAVDDFTINDDVKFQLDAGLSKALPGIMTLNWVPTMGVSVDGNSPINVAAREIYSFVRHANSGAANYDSTDLMIYLLAMDSIYSMYTDATRAYGLLNMYISTNRYMPKAVLGALGWDFEDLVANQAQFRWAINNIAYKISSFNVPNFMSYFMRHMWMNENVFMDKPNTKAQMYAYNQTHVYQYSPKDVETNPGGLTFVSVTSLTSGKTVSNWLKMMNTLIDPILASEDFGIMSGDILKAFTPTNLFSVKPIDIDYILVPGYNPEVLTQIINAVPMGQPYTTHETMDGVELSFDVRQVVDETTAEGYLFQRPAFTTLDRITDTQLGMGAARTQFVDRLITSDDEIPDVPYVVVSTRLVNCADTLLQKPSAPYTNISTWSDAQNCGTEVLCSITITTLTGKVGQEYTKEIVIGSEGIVFGVAQIDDYTDRLNQLSKFDWMPTLPILNKAGDKISFCGYYQDTCNYTLMTCDDLSRLHEAAVMSMFYTPATGSYNRR